MGKKYYKVLDDRRRVTLPRELCRRIKAGYNDVVSFEQTGDSEITLCKEDMPDNVALLQGEDIQDLTKTLERMSADALRELILDIVQGWKGGGDENVEHPSGI